MREGQEVGDHGSNHEGLVVSSHQVGSVRFQNGLRGAVCSTVCLGYGC